MIRRGRHAAPRAKGRQTRRFGRAVPLALAMVLVVAAVAWADDLVASGDDLVGNDIDFGEVCVGDPEVSSTVTLRAHRSSSNENNWWANGAFLSITVGPIVGAGLDAEITTDPAQIQLESTWTSKPTSGAENRDSLSFVEAEITLVPSTLNASDFINGEYEGSVTFRASGNRHTGGTLERTETIRILAQLCDEDGFDLDGFYQPVDNAVTNGAKAGRTIPLKFNILDADGVKQEDPSLVDVFIMRTACNGGDAHDLLDDETLSSGKTELRWDADGEQMIFNWKTPKTPGCYRIVLEVSGDSLSVDFDLK